MSPINSRETKDEFSRLQNILLLGGCLLALIPLSYLSYHIYTLKVRFIPVYLLVMLAGLISEYVQIRPVKVVLSSIVISFFISLIVFLPGDFNDSAGFSKSVQGWPGIFFGALILTMLIRHQDRFVLKVNECLIMLQSLAIIYWMLDIGPVIFTQGVYMAVAAGVATLVISSLYQAFSYKAVPPLQKLLLSVWSAIVFLYFGVNNASQLISTTDLNPSLSFFPLIFITAQYFMLGISSVYMAKSLTMISGFLKGKKESAKSYEERVRALTLMHISRVEDVQIKRGQSLTLILFSSLLFGVNYFLQLLPPGFVVWLVFITYPLVLFVYGRVMPTMVKEDSPVY